MEQTGRAVQNRRPRIFGIGGGILWLCCLLVPYVTYAQDSLNFRIILVKEDRQAQQILKRIKAGVPFWKLALDESLYPNASLGGYVEGAKPEELRQELRSALLALAPGGVSAPIPIQGGVAILKREPRVSSTGAWKEAEGQFLQAIRQGAQGDLKGAQRELQRITALHPDHQATHFALEIIDGVQEGKLKRPIARDILEAALLAREGLSQKAVERLQRAARDAPDVPAVQAALGEIYMLQGQLPEAISSYKKALVSPSLAVMAHLSLGAAYLRQGDASSALAHYQKAVAADMGLAQAHLGLGLVYLNLKRVEDALKEFRVALAIDPQLDPAYNQMGLVLLAQGNIEEAVWAFEKALSIRPDHPSYLNHLGFAYNRWGMFTKAVQILEHAVSLSPSDPMIHNNLAIAYYDNGQVDKAIYQADRAKSLGYQMHPDFLAKLAPYRKVPSNASR